MKVLFISDYLAPFMNGISVYSENTLRCLKKLGCEVVTFGPKGSPTADHWLPTLDMTRYLQKTLISFCFPNWKLFKEVLFGKYDVIHINCPQALSGFWVCLLAKFVGTKVVYFNHGNINIWCKYNYKSFIMKKLSFWFSAALYYFPHCLFKPTVVQNPGCNDLGGWVKRKLNIKAGSCGANLKLFTFSPSYEKYHLVSVGRLALEKNWGTLISFFARLPRHYRLTVIGEGVLKEPLKKLCTELGLENIVFVGEIKEQEVCSYLQKAQAYITASLFETWGLTLAEALACGTPVIYPNVNPFDQLYAKQLPEGAYEIEDPASFVKAVLQTEQADDQIRKKYHSFAQQFSWENATNQLMQVYQST